ncbi:hypothetical protein SERLA73DRAFT_164396 [Serpula lacrymans var. lacrymans S7.3]|uniref:Uncharacterized protein n=1 Tax=Serpula lacrymans var. lacrymans (strain S7.3) TaxID=936435 RepID=F8QIZ7_SERL3|nr:hypothetical protein SERLA73DRAFT_164396 [Serpula lacrymans var. lacrymans S7.3]
MAIGDVDGSCFSKYKNIVCCMKTEVSRKHESGISIVVKCPITKKESSSQPPLPVVVESNNRSEKIGALHIHQICQKGKKKIGQKVEIEAETDRIDELAPNQRYGHQKYTATDGSNITRSEAQEVEIPNRGSNDDKGSQTDTAQIQLL